MRLPTVNERLKEAPAHALRAAFAGIGQLLLVGDKLRKKASEQDSGADSSSPATPPAADQAATPTSADQATSPAAAAAAAAQAPAPTTTAATAAAPSATAAGSSATAAGGPATARPTGKAPIQGYEHLTMPSLRARLRGMSIAQVRALVDYERAHRGRQELILMYERRIEKLETEQG